MKQDLEEFEIEEDLNWIRSQSELSFKKIVKSKAKELTLELNPRKGKMKNLFYIELELQEYLKNQNISTSEARAVFKFKTRMANFSENFKEGGFTKPCPLCKQTNELDTQQHSLSCRVIKENIEHDVKYEDIFFSDVDVKTAKVLDNILKFRKEKLDL